ncbi:MAG: sugar transporter [Chitinivibrionales bacterium]|nr:sugar transporter [Chitinivibrionales bacterium]MBD3358849.1 sugar transporter [Chitinivibrionales bacterium]
MGAIMKKPLLFTLVCACVPFQAICGPFDSTVYSSHNRVAVNQNPAGEYRFMIGDVIQIKLYFNPELNETVTVRPDGNVSLQLVDEVLALGRTPAELDEVLTRRYAFLLEKVDVAVIVKKFHNRRLYIGGEVPNPGIIEYRDGITALQAIFAAGGFLRTARTRAVVILRNVEGEGAKLLTLDLRRKLRINRGRDLSLMPYDVVYVPKTGISRANDFVDQYFTKLIPVSKILGFEFIYDLSEHVRAKR